MMEEEIIKGGIHQDRTQEQNSQLALIKQANRNPEEWVQRCLKNGAEFEAIDLNAGSSPIHVKEDWNFHGCTREVCSERHTLFTSDGYGMFTSRELLPMDQEPDPASYRPPDPDPISGQRSGPEVTWVKIGPELKALLEEGPTETPEQEELRRATLPRWATMTDGRSGGEIGRGRTRSGPFGLG